jgi:tetratricopeptide (TPR) repeat protein
MARTSFAFVLLAALATAATASADERGAYAIPPGQEKLVLEMCGGDEPLPGGCRLAGASIDKSVIVARYACKGGAEHALELRHASVKEGALATTVAFSIAPKEGAPEADLVGAVAARVRKREEKFRWVEPQPTNVEAPTTPPPAETLQEGLTHEQSDRYKQGFSLYAAGNHREALALFTELARHNPRGGVLGMVVATLAATAPDPGTAAEYGRRADQAPSDTLAQFMAGVAAHYAAHQRAGSREQKDGLYATALRYLERASPAYDFEPRLFIYLAVSHFRLGHQPEAERLIESAVALGSRDPDVFYCRAEIFQHVDLERSLKDLDTYLALSEELQKQGAIGSPNKRARVLRMREHLIAVSRGEASADEIFDPVSPSLRILGSPQLFGLGVLGVGALGWIATGIARAVARRRRRAA